MLYASLASHDYDTDDELLDEFNNLSLLMCYLVMVLVMSSNNLYNTNELKKMIGICQWIVQ